MHTMDKDMRSQFASETAPPKLITVVRQKVSKNLETIIEEDVEVDVKFRKVPLSRKEFLSRHLEQKNPEFGSIA